MVSVPTGWPPRVTSQSRGFAVHVALRTACSTRKRQICALRAVGREEDDPARAIRRPPTHSAIAPSSRSSGATSALAPADDERGRER